MEILVKTSYEIGQKVDEKGLKGTVVRIEIIVHSEDFQDIVYILDNGGRIVVNYKKP